MASGCICSFQDSTRGRWRSKLLPLAKEEPPVGGEAIRYLGRSHFHPPAERETAGHLLTTSRGGAPFGPLDVPELVA